MTIINFTIIQKKVLPKCYDSRIIFSPFHREFGCILFCHFTDLIHLTFLTFIPPSFSASGRWGDIFMGKQTTESEKGCWEVVKHRELLETKKEKKKKNIHGSGFNNTKNNIKTDRQTDIQKLGISKMFNYFYFLFFNGDFYAQSNCNF